jgi:transcriptional regulator with XRE-family HTH domain
MRRKPTTPVSAALARLRRERGWTSYRLARCAGLPLPTLRLIEKGSDPRLSTVRKLAAALEVTVAALCDPEAR